MNEISYTYWAGKLIANHIRSNKQAYYEQDASGAVVLSYADRQLPAEVVAEMTAAAPAEYAKRAVVAEAAAVARSAAKSAGVIAAKYDGRCAVTGRSYRKGASIYRTANGWALWTGGNDQAIARTNPELIGALMDRADSSL